MSAPVQYDPTLVYNFQDGWDWLQTNHDDETFNDVLLNYIEVAWGLYFAVTFCIFGTELDRFGNFYYSMRLFGFGLLWSSMRTNPIFVDSLFLENFMRIFLSAVMAQFSASIFDGETFLQTWTTVTISTGFLISIADPYLRAQAGCEAGEPTKYFSYVGWDNCDDWQIAFNVTWLYSGITWFTMALACYVGHLLSNYEEMFDALSRGSMSVVCSSELISAMTAGMRIYGTSFQEKGYSGYSVSIAFYVIAIIGWAMAQGIHLWLHRAFDPEHKSSCISNTLLRIVLFLAQPLFLMETLFYKLEMALLRFQMKEGADADFLKIQKFAWGKSTSTPKKSNASDSDGGVLETVLELAIVKDDE